MREKVNTASWLDESYTPKHNEEVERNRNITPHTDLSCLKIKSFDFYFAA